MKKAQINRKLCIIPAAKAVAPEIQFDFGKISPIMIPFNGKPVLINIVESLADPNTDFLILSYKDAGLESLTPLLKKYRCDVIDVVNSNNIAESILYAQDFVKENNYDEVIINFGDTVVKNVDIKNLQDSVYYSLREDLLRWTSFETKDNKITSITDKNNLESDDLKKKVFVGLFNIKDAALFFQILSESINNKNSDLDPFWATIISYYNHSKTSYIFAKDWYDFGHIDNYYIAKNNYFNSRSFNDVSLMAGGCLIRKKSQNVAKFIDEINWFLKVPQELSYLFPKVINHDVKSKNPWIDLEFYGYPILSDLYVFANLDQILWKNIFKSIEYNLTTLSKYKAQNKDDVIDSLKMIYLDKTAERLQMIIDDEQFTKFTNKITINNKLCYSLSEVINMLPDILQKFGILEYRDFNIIHGDLCFSNMLYDRKSNSIKLIDPRGSFGKYDIYGDLLYDLAKLSHSILGGYDFAIAGLCAMEESDNSIKIHINEHSLINEVYDNFKNLLSSLNISEKDFIKIRLIESLLFLSMTPLHNDKPLRQKVFLATGLLLFSQIVDNDLK